MPDGRLVPSQPLADWWRLLAGLDEFSQANFEAWEEFYRQ